MSKNLGIILIGKVEKSLGTFLQQNLLKSFNILKKAVILEKVLKVPKEAYNEEREQYLSTPFLNLVKKVAKKEKYFRSIGITDVDLYVPRLNFVFGVATTRSCIISIYRLYPEFYSVAPNQELFLERTLKEVIHEIGHTFGLKHCKNKCIMQFSNSIADTDFKPKDFCKECSKKLNFNL